MKGQFAYFLQPYQHRTMVEHLNDCKFLFESDIPTVAVGLATVLEWKA